MSRGEVKGTTESQYIKIKKTIDMLKSVVNLTPDETEAILQRAHEINYYDEKSLDKSKGIRKIDKLAIIDNLNAEILASVGVLKIHLNIEYEVPFTFEIFNENGTILTNIFLKIANKNMNNKKFIKFKMDILRYSFIF